jgi:hypothetical protein
MVQGVFFQKSLQAFLCLVLVPALNLKYLACKMRRNGESTLVVATHGPCIIASASNANCLHTSLLGKGARIVQHMQFWCDKSRGVMDYRQLRRFHVCIPRQDERFKACEEAWKLVSDNTIRVLAAAQSTVCVWESRSIYCPCFHASLPKTG